MSETEYKLAAIKCQLDYLISALGKKADEAELIPEFVTLELAAKLKGGAAYNTYKSRYFLQPCGGTGSVRVGGKKCWRRTDVQEWLTVDDTRLDAYLQKFGVSAKKY